LILRMVVPKGYMIGFGHGSIMIELCSRYGPMG
jgi:hypothetical protein